MAVLPIIFRRDESVGTAASEETTYTPSMSALVTVLVALMLIGLATTGALLYIRNRRRRAAALRMQISLNSPPVSPTEPMMQKNMGLRAPAKPSHHRRTKSLTTPPDSPLFAIGETDSLMSEKRLEAGDYDSAAAHNAARRESVPQIHLTFPEELDEKTGRRESKVVVVTVTEKGGVGLSPFQQEQAPPAYSERDMKSLDLDRIGGLKESRN